MKARYALVRALPDSYDQCVTTQSEKIDVTLARKQHADYCSSLEKSGLKLIVLDSDNGLPDCVFVEDTAIVVDDVAIITNPGAPSRRAEVNAVEHEL
jgi:dimethylargininase